MLATRVYIWFSDEFTLSDFLHIQTVAGSPHTPFVLASHAECHPLQTVANFAQVKIMGRIWELILLCVLSLTTAALLDRTLSEVRVLKSCWHCCCSNNSGSGSD